MILIAGGAGFLGRNLVRQLEGLGKPVRILLRPSRKSPALPRGKGVEVAVSSLSDERGLRAAFKGIKILVHLVSDERRGIKADFAAVDIEGTGALVKIAQSAGVQRILYVSHLGADQSSAFAVLRTKAIVESSIIHSGIDYTIFRSAVLFGAGDQFTSSLHRLLKISPGFVFIPGDGSCLLQPIGVEDLASCLALALDDRNTVNQIYSVGGSEYLTFRTMLETIMRVVRKHRTLVSLSPVYIRTITLWLSQFLPRYPISIHWLDYLASDRTCSLDTLPRQFGIMPARFNSHLNYLNER